MVVERNEMKKTLRDLLSLFYKDDLTNEAKEEVA
jgi:hypothetical protein